MGRTKATAGFVVYPKPTRKTNRTISSNRGPKTWSQPTIEQFRCPLFRDIAAEIRFSIYRDALSILDDRNILELQQTVLDRLAEIGEHSVSSEQLIYRPPQGQRGYVELFPLSLLQTCQAVYTEARDLAISINTHVLLYPQYCALSFPIPTQATNYFSRMKNYQIEQVKHIQLFVGASRFRTFENGTHNVGGYRSETPFAEIALLRNGGGTTSRGRLNEVRQYKPIHPLSLTITIRDYDWRHCPFHPTRPPGTGYYFLADEFLRNKKWENLFGSLQCLKMELEIETAHKSRLKNGVLELMAYEFDVGNNRKLVAGPSAVSEGYWTRPGEKGYDGGLPTDEAELTVYTIIWKLVGA